MGSGPRRSCSIENSQEDDEYLNKLQRKELALEKKEKEIEKKNKTLERKIKKFKNRKKNKALSDLNAATKLRDARKKLLLTLHAKEKVTICNPRTCKKRNKTSARDSNTKRKKKVEKVQYSPVQYLSELLHRPCECSARGEKRRPHKEPDSYLKKYFVRPCKYMNKHNSRSYSPCKCGKEPPSRESYWERAAGDCYLMSLRRPPQLWLYHRWPQFYPQYLDARKQCKNCGHMLLFLAGILFWTPCILCLELCKCCFCACCTN